ncbi:MAG: hydrogenase formation protein HypD [Lachnospiraceae bacterium]|nr:hydrogenase formation protein HypD [Lachnospiraceae bacterium]
MNLEEMRKFLAEYDGEDINIMEVCGSHTAAISKNGIRELLSPKIHLISGPGCPVCVTPTAYVDKLVELSLMENTCVVTFGDMLRVPGSKYSLSEVQAMGGRSIMVYSPSDILALAEKEPNTTFVFASVGFETTTPVYALLIEEIIEKNMTNVKLLTALKTMPNVIAYLCEHGADIDGFLAPGHVAVITGSDAFVPLAEKYQIPFGVSGFEGEELLTALCGIIKAKGIGTVMNFYPSVVSREGNQKAQAFVNTYFEKADAVWRGMGMISQTGMVLKEAYRQYDAGSMELNEDNKRNKACCCDKILMGKMQPSQCSLFGRVCKPLTPQGACMVSTEGSCYSAYITL